MKKVILIAILFSGLVGSASAQTGSEKKVKAKKTSTVPQKVHNTFSKHKKYSGHKAKAKDDKPSHS